MLVYDQPLATAFHPDCRMPAIHLHRISSLQNKRQVKRQSHPSHIASTRDFEVLIGSQFTTGYFVKEGFLDTLFVLAPSPILERYDVEEN